MNKIYSRIDWKNEPNTSTPLNEVNLNKMDSALNEIDNRIIEQDTSKLDKSTANTMVKDVTFVEKTGIFTITYLNGSTKTLDTKLEKIATNFKYDYSTQTLILTLVDGTTQSIDMSALVTQYEFTDSSTIDFSVDSSGKVVATVKNGSITEDMLQPNYLAQIKVESANASQSATNAKTSENNAKTSEENALQYRNEAEEFANSVDTESAYITTTSTGNPITMQDTTEAPLPFIQLNGGMSQETTSGKNKLPSMVGTTQTIKGVTAVVNNDGSITFNGTSTAQADFYLFNSSWLQEEIIIENNDYLIVSETGNSDIVLNYGNAEGIKGNSSVTSSWTTINITFAFLSIDANVSLNNVTVYPMIRDSSIEDDTYEPYTGGIASPNPDYPQDIIGVGEHELDVEFTINNAVAKSDSVSCTPNMKYIVECDGSDSIEINQYDKNGTLIEDAWIYSGDDKLEFTAQGYSFEITMGGVTDASEASVRTYMTEVRTCRKNLIEQFRTGAYISASSNGALWFYVNTCATEQYIAVDYNGQYTLSCDISSYSCNVACYDSDKNFVKNITNTKTFTIDDESVKYIRLGIWDNTSTTEFTGTWVQLELGDTATTYEPYTETVATPPLDAPLYDGDYIEVYANGSGKIVRKMKSKTFTNNTHWYVSKTDYGIYQFANSLDFSDAKRVSDGNTAPNAKCNQFRTNTPNGVFMGNIDNTFSITYYTPVNCVFYSSKLSTLNELNTHLAENPMTFIYELATPTETPLTAEQVAELEKLYSFNEVTNVFAEDLATMDVEAYRNTDNGVVVSDINKQVKELEDNSSQYAIGEGLFLTIRNGQLVVSNGTQELSFVADSIVE